MSDSLRRSFWLHDIYIRDSCRHDLTADYPAGYDQLDSEERLSTAEFITFLIARRSDEVGHERKKFFLRDRSSRVPDAAPLPTPADAPVGYIELSREERFHVHEFIEFLLRRRDLETVRTFRI